MVTQLPNIALISISFIHFQIQDKNDSNGN